MTKKITVKDVEKYLSEFKKSYSTEMDDMFPLFKTDVTDLAYAYSKNEVYVYDKEGYIECLEEKIDDMKSPEMSDDELNEINEIKEEIKLVRESSDTIFIEQVGSEGYTSF